MSEVRIHLERCEACQKEYETYEVSLTETKEWLSQQRKEWEDREWEVAVQKAVISKPARVSSLMPWPYKRAWAYALMALLAVVLTVFIIRPIGFDSSQETGLFPAPDVSSKILTENDQQQVISMTLVSKETGLKIAWFFNKDFDFEEEK